MAVDQSFHFQTWKSERTVVLQSLAEWSNTDGRADLKHVSWVKKRLNKSQETSCTGWDITVYFNMFPKGTELL